MEMQSTDRKMAVKTTLTKAQQKQFEPSVMKKFEKLQRMNVKKCKVLIKKQDLQKLQKKFLNNTKTRLTRRSSLLKDDLKSKRTSVVKDDDKAVGNPQKLRKNNKKSPANEKKSDKFFLKFEPSSTSSSSSSSSAKKSCLKQIESPVRTEIREWPNISPRTLSVTPTKFSKTHLIKTFGRRFFSSIVKVEHCSHPLMVAFEDEARKQRSKRKLSKNLSVSFQNEVEILNQPYRKRTKMTSNINDSKNKNDILLSPMPGRVRKSGTRLDDSFSLDTQLNTIQAASTPVSKTKNAPKIFSTRNKGCKNISMTGIEVLNKSHDELEEEEAFKLIVSDDHVPEKHKVSTSVVNTEPEDVPESSKNAENPATAANISKDKDNKISKEIPKKSPQKIVEAPQKADKSSDIPTNTITILNNEIIAVAEKQNEINMSSEITTDTMPSLANEILDAEENQTEMETGPDITTNAMPSLANEILDSEEKQKELETDAMPSLASEILASEETQIKLENSSEIPADTMPSLTNDILDSEEKQSELEADAVPSLPSEILASEETQIKLKTSSEIPADTITTLTNDILDSKEKQSELDTVAMPSLPSEILASEETQIKLETSCEIPTDTMPSLTNEILDSEEKQSELDTVAMPSLPSEILASKETQIKLETALEIPADAMTILENEILDSDILTNTIPFLITTLTNEIIESEETQNEIDINNDLNLNELQNFIPDEQKNADQSNPKAFDLIRESTPENEEPMESSNLDNIDKPPCSPVAIEIQMEIMFNSSKDADTSQTDGDTVDEMEKLNESFLESLREETSSDDKERLVNLDEKSEEIIGCKPKFENKAVQNVKNDYNSNESSNSSVDSFASAEGVNNTEHDVDSLGSNTNERKESFTTPEMDIDDVTEENSPPVEDANNIEDKDDDKFEPLVITDENTSSRDHFNDIDVAVDVEAIQKTSIEII